MLITSMQKNTWKEFKTKNLGEYHVLYVQSDTLLFADVFENLKNKCTEIYELDPAHFLSAPGLAWQACLKKKTGIESELLTDIDMLLMVEKRIRGGISHVIHRYTTTNNKYMKIYYKNIYRFIHSLFIDSSYLMYLDKNSLHWWAMSQELPVNGFKWEKTY